jgi:hypothetical protein
METGRGFLKRHPQLQQMRRDSATWQQVKDKYRLKDLDVGLYLVRGDTLGDEDDLLLDVLARGSVPQGPDPLARRLFDELSAETKQAVRNELLQSDEKGEPI